MEAARDAARRRLAGTLEILTDPNVRRLLTDPDPHVRATTRRELGRTDPLLFALIYLPHHLRSATIADGRVTLSLFHLAAIDYLRRWAEPLPAEPGASRTGWVAPRDAAKSTWLFLIGPLWAGAYLHVEFIAAFSDSGSQAQIHLSSLRHELDTNELLRSDFPEFAEPARRPSGTTVADRQQMIQRANGFVMVAKGLDTGVLGLKVGELRPQVIVIDDGEPGEEQYTPYQKDQRLTTVLDSIFALNLWAHTIVSGTVTMPGSIVDDMRRHAQGIEDDGNQWVRDERVECFHFLPVLSDDEGDYSLWPEKWPLETLRAMAGTRSYAKNFENAPISGEAGWWEPALIVVDPGPPEGWGPTVLWIDPHIVERTSTRKRSPDWTGLAVISREPRGLGLPARCWVRWAGHTRAVAGAALPLLVDLIEKFEPTAAMIEANQGGDVWLDVFRDLPIPLQTYTEHLPKASRIERLLRRYQLGQVHHTEVFPDALGELLRYPQVANDDIIDAISSGVERMWPQKKKTSGAKKRPRSVSYR